MRRLVSLALLLPLALTLGPVPSAQAGPDEPTGTTAVAPAAGEAQAFSIDIDSRKRVRAGKKLKFVVTGTTDVRRIVGVTYAQKKGRRQCATNYYADTADRSTFQTVEPGPFRVKDSLLAVSYGPGRIKLCAYLSVPGGDVDTPSAAVASTTVLVRRRR